MSDLAQDADLLAVIRSRIQSAQSRVEVVFDSELVALYLAGVTHTRRAPGRSGLGVGVIRPLAADIRNELPEVQSFSERGHKSMIALYGFYPDNPSIIPKRVARLAVERGQAKAALSKVPQAVARTDVAHLPAEQAFSWIDQVQLVEHLLPLVPQTDTQYRYPIARR